MRPAGTIWYLSKYVAPPGGGGVGSRGYELMAELARLGHECVIITSDANHLTVVPDFPGKVLDERRDGLRMVWLKTFKAEVAKSGRRVLSWLDFERRVALYDTDALPRPDVIIASSLSLLTVLNGLRLRRKYAARLVFEVRDIWPLTLVEEGGFSESNLLVRALGVVERLGYRRADTIVGTMPALDKHVRAVVGRDLDVHCIPMGFSDRTVQDALPLPTRSDGRLVVGYAGTIGVTNAMETLLDAARLLNDRSDIEFRIIGDGPLLAGLKRDYADLGNVTWVDKVPKEQLSDELAQCDVLQLSTYPSRVWEFGHSLNKLIDYMLAARPVIAAYGGHPSMIDESGCGTFIEPGDPGRLAAEFDRFASMSPAERAAMGQRGRDWLLRHRTYGQLARDYEAILFPTAGVLAGGSD